VPVLHPAILIAGLSAVALPIIIHLLMRRRRKPVRWGAMRFVVEAYRKSQRKLTIERWLLLAARCLLLAIAALVLARPLTGALSGASGVKQTVYLLVDDSLTASAIVDGKTGLDRSKIAASEAISALRPGVDQVGLITLAEPAQGLVVPPSSDLQAVGVLLGEIKLKSSRASLTAGLAIAGGAMTAQQTSGKGEIGEARVVLLSDSLAGSVDLQAALARLPRSARIVARQPLQATLGNVAVSGLEAQRQVLLSGERVQNQTATVSVARFGDVQSGAKFRAGLAVTGRAEIGEVVAGLGQAGQGGAAGTGAVSIAELDLSPGQLSATTSVALTLGEAAGSSPSSVPNGPVAPISPANAGRGELVTSALVARVAAAGGSSNAIAGDDVLIRPIEAKSRFAVGIITEPAALNAGLLGSTAAEVIKPAQWLSLALRPSESVAIGTVEIDPASVDALALVALDAVFVTSADRLSEEAWRALGQWGRAGGLLVVCPPPGAGVQSWADAMVAGLGVPWQLARQAVDVSDSPGSPARISTQLGDRAELASSVLGAVAAELAELARPVSVRRIVPLMMGNAAAGSGAGSGAAGGAGVAASGSEARPVLTLTSGQAWLWVSPFPQVAAKAAETPANPAGTPVRADVSRGQIIYIASPMDLAWTDLPAKPLFVPLVQELLRQGISNARPLLRAVAGLTPVMPSYAVALRPLFWSSPDLLASVAGRSGAMSDIPLGPTGLPTSPINIAGLYGLIDATGAMRSVMAVDPNLSASDVRSLSPADVLSFLRTAQLRDGSSPDEQPAEPSFVGASGAVLAGGKNAVDATASPLRGAAGPMLLVLALLAAAAELVLARRTSFVTASTGVTAPVPASVR